MPKSFSFYYFPMVSQQPNRAKERKLNIREREREWYHGCERDWGSDGEMGRQQADCSCKSSLSL